MADDDLEVVQHPTLGPLKFPKDMPPEERQQSIDHVLVQKYGLPEGTNLREQITHTDNLDAKPDIQKFSQAYEEAHAGEKESLGHKILRYTGLGEGVLAGGQGWQGALAPRTGEELASPFVMGGLEAIGAGVSEAAAPYLKRVGELWNRPLPGRAPGETLPTTAPRPGPAPAAEAPRPTPPPFKGMPVPRMAAELGPPRAPIPSADVQLNEVAQRLFRRNYGDLSPEEQVVVARGTGGGAPEGGERRVLRGVAPGVVERRAEAMPLPTKAPLAPTGAPPFEIYEQGGIRYARMPGVNDVSIPRRLTDPAEINAYVQEKQALQRQGVPSLGGAGGAGPPAAPPPTTLPSTRPGAPPTTPPATLDEILRQATGQKELERGVPIGEQLRGPSGVTERPPPEDPIKAEFPDAAERQMVRVNGVELGRATRGNPELLREISNLKNWEIREAAVNSKIDLGTQHVGSRQGLGAEQVSRQQLLDRMIREGVKPEDIPRLARPETRPIGIENLKEGDTFVDDKGEPRRIVEITKGGKIRTADGTAREYEGSIDAHGDLNSPTAQLARGGKFIPGGSTIPLWSKPLAFEEKPRVADLAQALAERQRRQGLRPLSVRQKPQAAMERAMAIGESELDFQRKRANSGEDWYNADMKSYDDAIRSAHKDIGDNDDRLTIAKAIQAEMSLGNKTVGAIKNTLNAIDAWRSSGRIPLRNPETGGAWPNGKFNAYMNGFQNLQKLISAKGEKGAARWLMEQHPVSELREYRPTVGGKATDMQHGALILGDKAGPFFLNMMGVDARLTTDLWWSRTFNRYLGTPLKDGRLIEAPRSPAERSLMEDFARTLGQKKGLEMKQVQAILWNYEQSLYKLHGVSEEQPSYGQAARALVEERARRANAPGGGETPGRGANAPARRSAGSLPAGGRKAR